MSEPATIQRLSPGIVLSKTGLDVAIDLYKTSYDGELPTELVLNSNEDLDALILVVKEYNWLSLHFIRRLPRDFWMITGLSGIVWSSW